MYFCSQCMNVHVTQYIRPQPFYRISNRQLCKFTVFPGKCACRNCIYTSQVFTYADH